MIAIPSSDRIWKAAAQLAAVGTLLSIAVGVFAVCAPAQTNASNYLPLAEGRKWVLRNSAQSRPVEIEVVGRQGGEFTLRFVSPWNSVDWKLTPRAGAVALTGYGANGQTMPLPAETLFFDFESATGKPWSNQAGKFSVIARGAEVQTSSRTYRECITIRHDAGGSKFFYTFAPGVGFVRFGEGSGAFVLDEAASALGAAAPPASAAASTPQGFAGNGSRGVPRKAASSDHPASAKAGKPLLGVTVTTYANEEESPANLMKRFDQSTRAGITYISGAGKWAELEPSKGRYKLDSIDFQAHLAQSNGAKMSFTLRVIDTIHKAVPPDLQDKGWMDPQMQSRVLALIDAIAPVLNGRVQWFAFGNEIDGYFDKHPNEIGDYVRLYALVADHIHRAAPGVKVAASLQFAGLGRLSGALRDLDGRLECLIVTYYPLNGDFTVQDPSAPLRDLPRMRAAAGARQVVLQEIGYPTGAENRSGEQQQAQFLQNVFAAMRQSPDVFVAGNIFMLADLRERHARDLAHYYGIDGYAPFKTFLQTLGLFDGNGRPKQAWLVFQTELARP